MAEKCIDCIDQDRYDIRIYKIPFRPEYLLIEGQEQDDGPWSRFGLTNAASPTGRDVKAFRFHLSSEAVDLIIAQDPTVDYTMGYCNLTIRFDAFTSECAMIEVTRATRKKSSTSTPQ